MGSGGSSYKGEMKEVVVIGGGHAGFACAKQLADTQSDITITVISDKVILEPHTLNTLPWLIQWAVGVLGL